MNDKKVWAWLQANAEQEDYKNDPKYQAFSNEAKQIVDDFLGAFFTAKDADEFGKLFFAEEEKG